MLKITITALLLIAFFFIPLKAYAYDLEVQCDDTKCSLSSKVAIFPPSENWVPGESKTKEIKITNTGSHSKDIYMKSVGGNENRSLDDDVNLRFYGSGTNQNIWEGSLSGLLSEQTILISELAPDEDYLLNVEAAMNPGAPNELQGSTSTFDFSFGFDGEFKSDNNDDEAGDSKEDNNSNNSDNNQQIGGIITSNAPSTGNPIGNFFNSLLTSVEGAEEEDNDEVGGEVKGAITNQLAQNCMDNMIWVVAIVLQIAALILCLILKKNRKIEALQPLTFLVSAITILSNGCSLWPLILSSAIFVVAVLKYFKKLPFIKGVNMG